MTRLDRLLPDDGPAGDVSRSGHGVPMLALRRVLAFSVDYVVIAIYAGVITVVSLGLGASDESPLAFSDKIAGHIRSVFVLTLPVVFYFAIAESTGGTVGKRALRLAVLTAKGGKAGFVACFRRSLVKFGPWELAHAGVWYVPGRPFIDPPATANIFVWLVALGFTALLVGGMLMPRGRTIADRIAGTLVIHTPRPR